MSKKEQPKFDVTTHKYVPKHEKLSEEQKLDLLEKYNISENQLPKIVKNDAAIQKLIPEAGDVIKITRKSPTIGEMEYYRVVSNV
ncbi:DNA-directed RNA polymerase subunit H [archaeon]|nr:DNA-directed RNA polymerase subunit H [archaeon]|tara:strand:- start:608 stop:862 length:255 start_codon:yes stop_codon:yes gene_type:complete